MPVETMHLPRPLVNQLLHQAQQAAGFCQGWVYQDAHGRYRCAPLPANADFVTQAHARDERLFAYYRASNQPLPLPSTQQLQALAKAVGLYLGVALDVKGVLQLRGWRIAAGRVAELDLAISETGGGCSMTQVGR